MDIYIIAQFIGFLGYLFYIGAPYFKTQVRIIQMDVIACVILCAQWYLLDQPSLLVLNALAVLISVVALLAPKYEHSRTCLLLLYPIGCFAIISVSTGSIIDVMAIIAFCCALTSKSSQDITGLRAYAVIGGSVLIISGAIALSIPAMIFNILFVSGHAVKLWQNNNQAQLARA